MKCSKCNNTSNFSIFFDQLFEVQYQGKKLKEAKEAESDFPQIYPVICGECGDVDVEFNYKELEEIKRRIKTKGK